jgi:hypothetical protein
MRLMFLREFVAISRSTPSPGLVAPCWSVF